MKSVIIQEEWLKEQIKNPPPINVPEEKKKEAQKKIEEIRSKLQSKPFNK